MERFTKCDLCEYLHECEEEGLVINVTQPNHDYVHYVRNHGSRCKVDDKYMKDVLSKYPDLKEELENPTGKFPVSEEMRLAYEFWKENYK